MPNRRDFLKTFPALAVLSIPNYELIKGSVKHSVCRWCYEDIPLDELCRASKKMGIGSIDLLKVSEFEVVKKHGLVCAMVSSINEKWNIEHGWNKIEHHEPLIEYYKYLIDKTSEANFPHLICFSGNREENLNNEQGLENCVIGLQKILPYAEKKKVTLVMELLNSKIDHPNYMCDHTNWGVELSKRLSNDRFKLLYDIYHMQIMDGDVIRTIKTNAAHIAHYHTGGVPGRHEINGTQELHYPAIMKAIAETGFRNYVAQEFIPTRSNKLVSLKEAIEICSL